MHNGAALVLVDIQNDFLPTGALPVPGGDEVVDVANRLLAKFPIKVATQDWHPANHGSFASQHPGREPGEVIQLAGLDQILWPVHCVQNTAGAEFAPGLHTDQIDHVITKGTHSQVDSYSGFFDNGHRQSTGLADWLRAHQVSDIYVAGLATDYCVKFTVLDAVKEGFHTWLIEDGCRGVNLSEGDISKAMEEMRRAGASIIRSAEFA